MLALCWLGISRECSCNAPGRPLNGDRDGPRHLLLIGSLARRQGKVRHLERVVGFDWRERSFPWLTMSSNSGRTAGPSTPNGRLDAAAFHRSHEPIWAVLGTRLAGKSGDAPARRDPELSARKWPVGSVPRPRRRPWSRAQAVAGRRGGRTQPRALLEKPAPVRILGRLGRCSHERTKPAARQSVPALGRARRNHPCAARAPHPLTAAARAMVQPP